MEKVEKLEKLLLSELKELSKEGYTNSAFTIAIMGIEFLGAMIDDKPLRAEKQSSKRFKVGVRRFFPKIYGKPSIVEVLYKNLRCNIGHLMLSPKRIQFVEEGHLREEKEYLAIDKKQFVRDYILAVEKLLAQISSGKYLLKKGIF